MLGAGLPWQRNLAALALSLDLIQGLLLALVALGVRRVAVILWQKQIFLLQRWPSEGWTFWRGCLGAVWDVGNKGEGGTTWVVSGRAMGRGFRVTSGACFDEKLGCLSVEPEGGLNVARLGVDLFFSSLRTKMRQKGYCTGGFNTLRRIFCTWKGGVGCFRKNVHAKEVRVTLVGLPLHFWSRDVFRKIGDCFGGFLAVDEDTASFSHLEWVRVLVKSEGRDFPGSL